jgi:hypothetical protein
VGKIVLVLFAIVSHPSMAQITFGTVITLNFTKDRLVVAADSRGSHPTSGETPDDLECKLTQFHHTLLFTSSGAVGYRPSPSVAGWDNVTVAQEAVREAAKQNHGRVGMASVSADWAKTIVQNWQIRFGVDREQVIRAAEVGHGALTVGFFAQASEGQIDWIVDVIKLDPPYIQPIASFSTKELSFCWSCGQPSGKRLCAGGEVEIATQVCSELDSHKSVRKPPSKAAHGWAADEILPVSVAETVADRDRSGDIHGPIDAIELTKAGKMRWLRKKSNCPRNLD